MKFQTVEMAVLAHTCRSMILIVALPHGVMVDLIDMVGVTVNDGTIDVDALP